MHDDPEVPENRPDEPPVPEPEMAQTELSVAELQAQISNLEQQASEHWDRFARAQAEQENIRKRAEREVENARRYALERFANDLLGALDSLELGLKAAADAGATEAHLEGMTLTLKLLSEACEKHGIKAVDPAGESFDPAFHEAVSTVTTADAPANSVLQVLQKGYLLGERLLRPAMVIVTQAPAAPN